MVDYLETESCVAIRKLSQSDATDTYVTWMNDYLVTRYTESRFYPQDISTIRDFISNANNANNIAFAIVERKTNKHIGNVKLGGINWIHRYCDIGLIIGEKDTWGKGYGTEAIYMATEYAFRVLNLRLVFAGIYEPNIASVRAFAKAGYTKAYTIPNRYFFEDRYVDCCIMEKRK